MKLPTGSRVAESQAGIADLLQQYGQNFKGSINVYRDSHGLDSHGFVLLDNGTVLAAAFNMLRITLYQLSALDRMMSLPSIRSEIIALTDEEIKSVILAYPHAALVLEKTESSPAADGGEPAVTAGGDSVASAAQPEPKGPLSYDRLVSAFATLPGVVGSALVADGFPVYQQGSDVDFEHVAAATEDMVRAGTRIASELQLGNTGQIILETPDYKVIIAPVNDMFLCVLARTDTNLGLIRLNIKNAQQSQSE